MFIPWWGVIVVALLLVYLIVTNVHLHNRVMRLEKIVRRLEGLSEEDIKKQIKERMLDDDGGGD